MQNHSANAYFCMPWVAACAIAGGLGAGSLTATPVASADTETVSGGNVYSEGPGPTPGEQGLLRALDHFTSTPALKKKPGGSTDTWGVPRALDRDVGGSADVGGVLVWPHMTTAWTLAHRILDQIVCRPFSLGQNVSQ
jgi:hypothetical protein